MLLSSGEIGRPFVVVDLVIGFASLSEGCSGGIKVEETYRNALNRLTESAKALNADGLMYINFQNRVSSQTGCSGVKPVFEVFAWGTAVKFQ